MTSNLIEAIVSVNRLSKFFQADELQTDARTIVVKDNLQEGDEVSDDRVSLIIQSDPCGIIEGSFNRERRVFLVSNCPGAHVARYQFERQKGRFGGCSWPSWYGQGVF